MSIEFLLKRVTAQIAINEAEADLIRRSFIHKTYPKNTVLEEAGVRIRRLYFLRSGIIRTSGYEGGAEVTTHLAEEGSFVTGFKSFAQGTLSEEQLQCVTDCELLYISKASYDTLYEQSANWRSFCKHVYESSLLHAQQRTKEMLTLSAEARYLKILSDRPAVMLHVPVQYIASYIGIKPESLSRIRKKLFS